MAHSLSSWTLVAFLVSGQSQQTQQVWVPVWVLFSGAVHSMASEMDRFSPARPGPHQEPEEDAATGSPPGSPRQSPSGVAARSAQRWVRREGWLGVVGMVGGGGGWVVGGGGGWVVGGAALFLV